MLQVQFDEIGYWSEVKLEIVRKYAAAYTRILATQPSIRGHLYIDGFAGAGQGPPTMRSPRRFANGSRRWQDLRTCRGRCR